MKPVNSMVDAANQGATLKVDAPAAASGPTPRTDEVQRASQNTETTGEILVDYIEFARKLERELTKAKERAEAAERKVAELQARIDAAELKLSLIDQTPAESK